MISNQSITLVKQLAKLFPVYFSEIGSEGVLRDVSAEIDDVTGRADSLIHFLRKQSHVESSARVVDFIEEIINFWRTKDKTHLKRFLPEDIYQQVRSSGLILMKSVLFLILFLVLKKLIM